MCVQLDNDESISSWERVVILIQDMLEEITWDMIEDGSRQGSLSVIFCLS